MNLDDFKNISIRKLVDDFFSTLGDGASNLGGGMWGTLQGWWGSLQELLGGFGMGDKLDESIIPDELQSLTNNPNGDGAANVNATEGLGIRIVSSLSTTFGDAAISKNLTDLTSSMNEAFKKGTENWDENIISGQIETLTNNFKNSVSLITEEELKGHISKVFETVSDPEKQLINIIALKQARDQQLASTPPDENNTTLNNNTPA